jgi:hypothetical protein
MKGRGRRKHYGEKGKGKHCRERGGKKFGCEEGTAKGFLSPVGLHYQQSNWDILASENQLLRNTYRFSECHGIGKI